MPINAKVFTITGLSSSASNGYDIWVPDTSIRPFNIGIGCVINSSAVTYSIEHTFDYNNSNTANPPNKFISTAATWFQNSTIAGATGNLTGNYAFPETAIRLNVTAGSSTGTVTATLVQAG